MTTFTLCVLAIGTAANAVFVYKLNKKHNEDFICLKKHYSDLSNRIDTKEHNI